MRRLLAWGVAGLLAAGVATPAYAAAPERTGWWNALSAGAVVAPAPTTAAGDLRIANGPDGPLAYAAVLLTSPGATSATLDLLIRPGTVLGTPEVVACPTKTEAWTKGGNQPIAAAPGFDCAKGELVATLSADGKSLSFDLDAATASGDGRWSLALVPQTGSTTPFALDLQAPGPDSFTPAQADAVTDPGTTTDPAADPGTSDPDADTSGGAGSVGDLLLPGSVSDVPSDSGTAAPPLLPDSAPVLAVDSAPAPGLAGAAPQQQLPAGRLGTVATRPVAQDLPGNSRERFLALLMLVAISAGVGYLAGQQRPGPRLLGGRAGSAAAVAGVPEPPRRSDPRERGIGRFAKPRSAAPRRLR